MRNKSYPYSNTTAAAVGRLRAYFIFVLVIIGFLVLESCAFYSIHVYPIFDNSIVSARKVERALLLDSRSSSKIVSTHAKSGDQFPPPCYADSSPTAFKRTKINQKSIMGRHVRWRQRKIYDRNMVGKTQTLVPHAGRHFFPSHPAYRRTLFRRLFSKVRKRKRFMEGWYYRLTLKEYEIDGSSSESTSVSKKPVSFAFIISIEDAGIASSDLRLACLQAIGPDDQYLVQSTKDDTKFWASKNIQSLGCTFEEYHNYGSRDDNSTIHQTTETELDPAVWKEVVRSGFQIIDGSTERETKALHFDSKPRWMGRILGHDGSKGGVLDGQGVQGSVEFDFEVDPNSVCGYGGYTTSSVPTDASNGTAKPSADKNSTMVSEITGPIRRREKHDVTKQKSTGGWLSSFPVFEPHWQVTIADALASGSVNWNGTQYKFKDQPFYAEKNWGDALPSKWYWTQCNSFDNYGDLTVTAGGGVRKLPFGKEEELGMVAIHYKGKFYEAVPWKGNVEWNVSTWGEWSLYGDRLEETTNYGLSEGTTTTPPFAAEIRYSCDPEKLPGLVFRAPTPKQGMVPFCRDTFEADCELTLWALKRNEVTNEFERIEPPIIDRATSQQGGAEIGGGSWWSEWQGKSELKPMVKALLNFPKNLISTLRRKRRVMPS